MDLVTEDQVRQAVKEHDIKRYVLRCCSICGSELSYIIKEDQVFYDSCCDCSSFWRPPELRSFDDIVENFNIQSPEVRVRMWQKFITSSSKDSKENTNRLNTTP